MSYMDEYRVFTLTGALGAGKTTLTQAIARELGITERLVSPTFVIMKLYQIKDSRFKHLIHIDAYRLNSCDELLKLGWNDIIADPDPIGDRLIPRLSLGDEARR